MIVGDGALRSINPRRPVDALAEVRGAQVDQAAALDWPIVAVNQREPVDRAPMRIDDQDLIQQMTSVEGKLLSRLVAGRDDLDDERRGWRKPHATRATAMQPASGTR